MKACLVEMRSFAMVAEQGGFTAAARAIGVSKGLVSQQISRLEQALAGKLLFRSTRKVTLTETGTVFLGYCQRIIENADAAFEAVEVLRAAPLGTVRVTVPVSFGAMFLNDIISTFRALHPGIQIELELENRCRDLRAAHIDIAIRVGMTDDPELVAVPLGEFSERVCASPAYWQSHPPLTAPADLAAHDCLINMHYCKDGRWVFFGADGAQSIPVTGSLRLNHYPLLCHAAGAGFGVVRLPRHVAQPEIAKGVVQTRLDNYRSPRSPIYLAYPYQGSLPVKNRLLIDFVRDWFHARPDLLETRQD